MPSLAERLGYASDAKLLIVNADDLGFCHSANVGTFHALRSGLATSATLMVPCPWAREAAARYRGEDVGVHLTLNAEWPLYRWGPITHAPSLLGGDGGFPETVQDVWDHADLDEVRRECRAQIERAILWGFDVSHIDAHLSALQLRPEFFDIYLELALDFQLPLRMTPAGTEAYLGFPARELAAEAGAVFADDMVVAQRTEGRHAFEEQLRGLAPGVTEVHIRPALDSAELRAVAPDWTRRVDDYRLAADEQWLRKAVAEAGVILIGYRPLRELARAGR